MALEYCLRSFQDQTITARMRLRKIDYGGVLTKEPLPPGKGNDPLPPGSPPPSPEPGKALRYSVNIFTFSATLGEAHCLLAREWVAREIPRHSFRVVGDRKELTGTLVQR